MFTSYEFQVYAYNPLLSLDLTWEGVFEVNYTHEKNSNDPRGDFRI